MRPALQRTLFIGIIVTLIGVLGHLGKTQAELERRFPYSPQTLLRQLASSNTTLQLVDARPKADEATATDDDVGDFEETHIPGAIPLPDCDVSKGSPLVLSQISSSIPTVIISKDGSRAVYEKCIAEFSLARNLFGGMVAWVEEGYPEADGEFVPPTMGTGGGCL